eukprot:comp21593_c0_seq5/m.30221 comp21593_c0_seq5/g.30221  ORF comp21593_c0_seq5/g.30221 comp21593_c0_seq5/m.30221 type:complete len:323 (-) comp21593_c0_seq5:240-1208(-)
MANQETENAPAGFDPTWVKRGQFSEVRHHVRDNQLCVVKQIRLDRFTSESLLREIDRESRLLRENKHQGIVEYIDHWIDYREWEGAQVPMTLNLVMELMEGDLFDLMVDCVQNDLPAMPEPFLKHCTWQVLQTLEYLHHISLCHRDIKPANVLYKFEGVIRPPVSQLAELAPKVRCKLADFGWGREVQKAPATTLCGTEVYMAPEILTQNYDACIADMYSLGATVAVMMGLPEDDIPQLACLKDPSALFPPGTDQRAIDFVQKLCRQVPSERPSAKDALWHLWFTQDLKAQKEWFHPRPMTYRRSLVASVSMPPQPRPAFPQ